MNNSKILGVFALFLAGGLVIAYTYMPRDRLTLSLTNSVPRGLYFTVAQEKAKYVSFCLSLEHRTKHFYNAYCSPDAPEGTRILKRINNRKSNGAYVVQGDAPRSIDSRVIGDVMPGQQRQFLHPLWVSDQRKDAVNNGT